MEARPQIMENGFPSPRRTFDFTHNSNASSFPPAAESSGFSFVSPVLTGRELTQSGTAGGSSSNPFVFGSFAQNDLRGEYLLILALNS